MLFNEKNLRIYGQLVLGLVMFAFFQLPVLATPHKLSYIFLRMLGATVLWVVTIWEPTRFIILRGYKYWRAQHETRKRIVVTSLIILPVTCLCAYLRIHIENLVLWKMPVHDIPYLISYFGTNLLFVIAQIALYETVFYVEKWYNSEMEAKELKKINLQIQFDSLKVQIQPHFLFNTLNTLIGLMKIDTLRAIQFTEEMARVYRYLLQANDRQLIGLDEEMKFTRAYFFLLKTRYSEGLHLHINEENNMDSYQLPPLSVQILIENAVKHNVITRDKPLFIKIDFNSALKEVTVSNNLQRKTHAFHSGLGLVHLKKKFELLNISGVRVADEDHRFSVTVPLIKSNENEYAGSNY